MEGIPGNEKFRKEAKKGDIIVAGKNFGCGSSREQAPESIKGMGIKTVIAKSFATIFYRNAVNVGLTLIECKGTDIIGNGDLVIIDAYKGEITNAKNRKKTEFIPLPQLESDIIEAGGLINYLSSLSAKGRLKSAK